MTISVQNHRLSIFFFIFFVNGFFFCNNQDSQEDLEITKVGTHALTLDKETGHYYYSLVIQKLGGRTYATLVNSSNRTVYIYDWQSGKIVDKLKIPHKGPEGIVCGATDAAFLTYAPNTLFYYASGIYKMFKINGANVSKVYENLGINSNIKDSYYDIPEVSASFQPLVRNDYVFYLTNGISYRRKEDYTTLHSLLSFKGDNYPLTPDRMIMCPPIYNTGIWGRTLGYLVHHCFNNDSTAIITSFAKYDSLVITNLETNSQYKVPAGSRYFSMADLAPISEGIAGQVDLETGVKYDFTEPCYFQLYYDEVAERYYRLTQYDFPTQEVVAKNKGEIRLGISYSIIVLDKELRKLGEVTLPKVEDLNMNYFFAKDGFVYIAPLPKYQPFEDSMLFNKYEITIKGR